MGQRALARADHWSRVLEVVGTTQVTRTPLRIQRCCGGPVALPVDQNGITGWLYSIADDQAAMLSAVVWQSSC